jgi:hypothetical protein
MHLRALLSNSACVSKACTQVTYPYFNVEHVALRVMTNKVEVVLALDLRGSTHPFSCASPHHVLPCHLARQDSLTPVHMLLLQLMPTVQQALRILDRVTGLPTPTTCEATETFCCRWRKQAYRTPDAGHPFFPATQVPTTYSDLPGLKNAAVMEYQ